MQAAETADDPGARGTPGTRSPEPAGHPGDPRNPGNPADLEDTADLSPFPGLAGAPAGYAAPAGYGAPCPLPADSGDLLDRLADWGPLPTQAGVFQLVPVRPERDLSLVATWMNDPVVDAFWNLAGPASRTAAHLRAQLEGDGRSIPCLGLLDGLPMSYWEIYRADLDPLARYYPSRLHDTGLHLLIGSAEDRGRGLGSALLRGVTALVLRHRPRCERVVAEPDIRNHASVAAFRAAGFRHAGQADLPHKRAALLLRER
ncbi:GNAT family N-acetyltransferase [Streptomyces hoynatensis]|uniref:Lysine N-acyltransferase MbtK n=1 Tax=Streptomyces hoynatensis TaxID=1141874 RepID=A0A3A9YPD4_9ACTN|nr:GNAT family N-acetyltransferase [Streptomyces hoynatensis]RKN37852.1 N-acetyltransferase [Streptomyces hoynatensis]